ncbi:MAG TPA: ABC transporter permease subunit [Alphaproteobacteria bacterium]|nr:ABC transporter permease subunit [Alphaproteobacteria bacterium]
MMSRTASMAAVVRAPAPWRPYIGVAPLILFLVVLFIYPIVDLLWLSFFDREGQPSAMHYRAIAESPVWLSVMLITFEISGWTTIFCVLAGYPVAYLLATSSEATRNRLILWVMLPFWTSFLVRTFAWIVLLSQKGPINRLVSALGLSDAPLELIYNFTGVMIGMVHALMPLAVLTMLSVMTNIDSRLRSAAATLGARGGESFWRIYFPLSLPGVAAAGLMVFITALGFFITPALLGGRRQTMISQVIIVQVQDLLNWSFAGALSLVLLASALLIFFLYDRLLGLSTLSGSARTESDVGAPSWFGRLGATVGARALAAAGRLCDLAQQAWERLFPPQGGRPRRAMARLVLWLTALTIIGFLVLPALIVVPVSFTGGRFVSFPPEGVSLQWYDQYFGSSAWMEATVRSFVVATFTGALSMLLGVPAAFMLVRARAPAKAGLLALILSPLIIPRIVVAVAIYIVYAKVGLVGTSFGLVLGHTVLAAPYVVITMMAVLKTYDERLDQAAASLGASPWRTLTRITFPLIRGGMIASFLFAFIASFDDLTIALFVSGGLVSTLPRQMWNDMLLQVNPTLAAVSTTMLVVITVIILAAEYLRRRATQS